MSFHKCTSNLHGEEAQPGRNHGLGTACTEVHSARRCDYLKMHVAQAAVAQLLSKFAEGAMGNTGPSALVSGPFMHQGSTATFTLSKVPYLTLGMSLSGLETLPLRVGPCLGLVLAEIASVCPAAFLCRLVTENKLS